MMMLTENWDKLSAEEKYQERMKAWMSPNIEFASPEAAQAFKQRTQMVKDAIELKKPERVPICLNVGFYPGTYAGVTAQELMYDYAKLGTAFKKFNNDFQADSLTSCLLAGAPGKVFEILDYKLYQWPGHGTDPNTPYQCLEDEYMLDSEYDLLINDPSGYWMRYYLPRVIGAMGPWKMLSPFTDIVELPFMGAYMIPLGLPELQESFQKLLAAGQAALEWIGSVAAIDGENAATHGLPAVMGGFAKAPFDTLGDTLRGTRPIMMDMFRRPKKLIEAMERLVPIAVEAGARAATVNRNPMVFMPLHKGADGFMSNNDYAKFYWPTLKAVILGLIKEGLVPYIFVEGSYNQRLEFLADPELPEGKIVWLFDTTDMVSVKKYLGGKSCFGGNVPGSMLKAGTPQQVEEYVKFLIENVGQDGGYILSNGAVLDDAEPENLHAMLDAGRKYGTYSSR